jgi:hypothetical protein
MEPFHSSNFLEPNRVGTIPCPRNGTIPFRPPSSRTEHILTITPSRDLVHN